MKMARHNWFVNKQERINADQNIWSYGLNTPQAVWHKKRSINVMFGVPNCARLSLWAESTDEIIQIETKEIILLKHEKEFLAFTARLKFNMSWESLDNR